VIPLKDNIRSKSFPWVGVLLIALNFVVFYHELKLPNSQELEHFVNRFAVVPALLWKNLLGQSVDLVTATFIHGGWMHILSNMLFLYIFGDNVEDSMGHGRFLIFYLLVGVVANGGQAFLSPHSVIPMIGASGAIAGVLGSYFYFYPHARIVTLIPIFVFFTIREIPAYFFLGIWFILQTFNGVGQLSSELVTRQSMGGVAWWAHAIGFVAGLLAAPIFGKRMGKYK
jgi:membrane associated rhomboid family serine protease